MKVSFLTVLNFQMKIIMSRDLEATPIGGATSKPGPSCSKLTTSLVNDSSKFQNALLFFVDKM